MSDSLWPHGLQHARLPCPSPTPEAYSNSCPSVGDAIQPSHPLSSPSPPAFNLSQHQGLFQWVSSLHQVAKVLALNILCCAVLSHSVVSNSLQPHGLQHARLPCPSPNPGACLDSCSSQWCHPTVSSSVIPFSSCLQFFTASGSFPKSQLFTPGGQSTGVSASPSVLPMNSQDWFPLGWTGWISLQSKGLSRIFSNTTVQKHHFFGAQLSL